MDTHRALIAMGGVGARLLDHGQRVRFALKMGLWGPKRGPELPLRGPMEKMLACICALLEGLPLFSCFVSDFCVCNFHCPSSLDLSRRALP